MSFPFAMQSVTSPKKQILSSCNVLLLTLNSNIINYIISLLKNPKYNVYVLSNDKNSSLKYSIISKGFFHISSNAKDSDIVEEILSKHEEYNFDRVIATDFNSTLFLSRNSHQMEGLIFPTTTEETILKLHNKWEFYKLCNLLNIPTPITRNELVKDLPNFVEGFPAILKPIEQGGQERGIKRKVKRVRTKKELIRYISITKETNLLIQDFIQGCDRDISVLALNGEILLSTIQEKVSKNKFQIIKDDRLEEMARKIVKATKFSGLAHFDLRIDNEGVPYMIECNPRTWFSMSLSKKAGVNYLAAMFNETPNTREVPIIKYGIMKYNPNLEILTKDPFVAILMSLNKSRKKHVRYLKKKLKFVFRKS